MSFPVVTVALASLLAACSGTNITERLLKERTHKALGSSLPADCLYGGRWFSDGGEVDTREACLQCICSSGALTCRRRACAPLPDPPPRKCHAVYRKGSCCPELQCPDGVAIVDHSGAARSEDNLKEDFLPPTNVFPACVEGGTVYAAGSALRPTAACESCFCLQAERRCLRPKCLPPPPGCKPQPASGACCPQRYYCQHAYSPHKNSTHDCQVKGAWVPEGQRVKKSEENSCSQCFCLRGAVRCHTVQCAPPLRGCTPFVVPGECCPRHYHCEHGQEHRIVTYSYKAPNSLLGSGDNEDRSFHDMKTIGLESTTGSIITKINTPSTVITNDLVATTKVKRKTDEISNLQSAKPDNSTSTVTPEKVTTTDQMQTDVTTEKSVEQSEGTVKIMVNGTINCTAELSSTKIPYNTTLNETNIFDVQPRIPIVNTDDFEPQTYPPNDIITDRTLGFDESETFTINVTSSLVTNTSQTKPPIVSASKPIPNDMVDAANTSKKTKGDYDYDYTEPTLPPSLPNLKIIPFVAADAVVDDETSKATLTYPILEREDKFPVYYPTSDTKDTLFATRREDVYPPKYPVFISNKGAEYPSLLPEINLSNSAFGSSSNDLEYTVPTALDDQANVPKVMTAKPSSEPSKYEVDTPAISLFSPPAETEGGFVPKDPEDIDKYYAVYPSPAPGPSIPHLTTSMQLDVAKECITSDGRRVKDGHKTSVWCSNCACQDRELRCIPRDCSVPSGCNRLPITSEAKDLCCGDLVCNSVESTTTPTAITTENQIVDDTRVKVEKFSIKQKNDSQSQTDNQHELKTEQNIKPVEVNSVKDVTDGIFTATLPPPTVTAAEIITTPVFVTEKIQPNETNSNEYEDDEDDSSFGSLLQLLLSGEIESTTAKPKTTMKTSTTTSTARPYRPTLKPFIPLPPRPYIPPYKASVNRIDHLVLGEATAIHTTPRSELKTNRPEITRSPAVTEKDKLSVQYTSVTHEGPRPPNLGLGGGILKISGCNIYGKMYGVGHFVPELTTKCQECWCADYGVQCKSKGC
ncbi:uncharacterized protein LOC101735404 isoform X1 [Bombyx mori]|uniref:VWFC domain-containing protein n=1 Tax=Bombyx mori TaxID=7091 RepID=A0A8R2GCK5_BOMMO|nr:uncharacterized protein LOC101735404 isoform X1 [Bombyx mori]